ncbi:MAG: peptidyl-prolyl cis-trans isomerase [Bauldia sp.]|nr:peptidyl-prolyl cis-trans isomerase [Bauldia sp.]
MRGPLQPDVVVNAERIPARLIAAETQNHAAPPGKPGHAWRAAARALAVRALLLQEARRLGLAPEPRDLGAGRREVPEEALIRAVIERRMQPVPPDEDACRAFYNRHEAHFRAPAVYEASHILIAAPEDADARTRADAAARALLGVLATRPQDFADMARRHSDCPSGANGGRLGQLCAGDTAPEFEAALGGLAVGAITPEPVATRYGSHIVRLDAREQGAILPFDLARPRIRETLERLAWSHAAKSLVAVLLEGATITGVDFNHAA